MGLVGRHALYGGEAVLGFVLGGLAGFLLAVLFVHVKPAERGLLPYVIASQTVPIIAIAPMIVVGMGRLGAPPWLSKSIIAAYLTFFPVTINVLRGLTSVHRDQLALMHSYAASKAQIFFKVAVTSIGAFLVYGAQNIGNCQCDRRDYRRIARRFNAWVRRAIGGGVTI